MKKYTPKTKQELQDLVDDESIYLGDIDTSLITDMSDLFLASERKNFKGIETWNTSKVENMESMFSYAKYFNEDISTWDVTNTYYFSNMFYCATSFNQNLSKWNMRIEYKHDCTETSTYEYIRDIFYGAKSFKQDISTWKNWRDELGESILEKNINGSGIDKEYKGEDLTLINQHKGFCLHFSDHYYTKGFKKHYNIGYGDIIEKEKENWYSKNRESSVNKFITKKQFNHLHTINIYYDIDYIKYFIFRERFKILLVTMDKKGYRVVGEYNGYTRKYEYADNLSVRVIKPFEDIIDLSQECDKIITQNDIF